MSKRAGVRPGRRRRAAEPAEAHARACAESAAAPGGSAETHSGRAAEALSGGADDQRRERAAPGPEDRALYVCRCGSAFAAHVSASVRCPHCGETQAW
jgi:hypothetical protein